MMLINFFAQMASIQEQLKHIRAASDDWYDEHKQQVQSSAQSSASKKGTDRFCARVIGELGQLSTSTPRSHSSTPQPEKSYSDSDGSRNGGKSSQAMINPHLALTVSLLLVQLILYQLRAQDTPVHTFALLSEDCLSWCVGFYFEASSCLFVIHNGTRLYSCLYLMPN